MSVVDPKVELEFKKKVEMEKKYKNISSSVDVDRKLLHPTDPYSSTVGLDELIADCSVRQADGAVLCRAKIVPLSTSKPKPDGKDVKQRRREARARKRRHRLNKKR